MFGLSATVIIGCMGAAMDFSTLSNAESRSQSIADQTALSAAIFVKNYDRPPQSSDEGVTAGTHSAENLGYDFKGWVDGGAENVTVNVVYDDNAKEARVSVTGKTVPTFVQIFGKQKLDFSAESVVSYLDVDEMHSASVVLVLDNSGSMRWDSDKMKSGGIRPDNPKSRMDGLQTSVRTFRDELRSRIGDQKKSNGHRVLRTGILPYNSAIIPRPDDAERKMAWGFNGVSEKFVGDMKAEGGTNSNPPMAEAREWLTQEDTKHRTEAARNEETYRQPLKFVVFMTDGQNTSGDYIFEAQSGTGYYYKQISGNWYYTRNPYWANYYGYREGVLRLDSDEKTIESCQAMHAAGTTVYTIGYALEVGNYYDPLYPSDPGVVTEATRATAYSLLSSCASKPEFFIQASDGNELEGAFDQIQNSIVKELIRIKT
jgi:hypothetical protein